MKKIIFATFLICLSSINLFAQANSGKEEYAVYDAALRNIHGEWTKQSDATVSFVVLEDTVKLDFVPSGMNKKSISEYVNNKFTYSKKDLLTDFTANNQNSVKLEKQSPTDYEYDFVSKAELENLMTEGRKEFGDGLKRCNCVIFEDTFSWQPLRRKYPNTYGIYQFSRVGFSSDKKYALVFVNREAGDSGDASFYILEKTDDKWKVQDKIHVSLWIT
jgi:hypothetical protein